MQRRLIQYGGDVPHVPPSYEACPYLCLWAGHDATTRNPDVSRTTTFSRILGKLAIFEDDEPGGVFALLLLYFSKRSTYSLEPENCSKRYDLFFFYKYLLYSRAQRNVFLWISYRELAAKLAFPKFDVSSTWWFFIWLNSFGNYRICTSWL